MQAMGIDEFKRNVESAVKLLSKQTKGDLRPTWLNEEVIAGMADAGLETLPSELGFPLGTSVARFRRIAQEVAEADGIALPEQCEEAAKSLRTIARILKSFPTT
jgi:hypothetical protein